MFAASPGQLAATLNQMRECEDPSPSSSVLLQAGLACKDSELQPRRKDVGVSLRGSFHRHRRGGNRSVSLSCLLHVTLLCLIRKKVEHFVPIGAQS